MGIISIQIILIVLCIGLAAGYWQCFEKAGYEGWKCLVPLYNLYLIAKIAKASPLVLILFLVPLGNLLAMAYLSFKFTQAFGKSTLFSAASTILFPITIPIIGFSKSEYIK
jgi:hypothetical protein